MVARVYRVDKRIPSLTRAPYYIDRASTLEAHYQDSVDIS